MLTAFIRFGDGRIVTETDIQTLESAVRDPDCLFWLDICQGTELEMALLKEVFGFHPLAIEDTMGHIQRPKVESYAQTGDSQRQPYVYMVTHGPDLETFRKRLRTKELDMFVSARYLVTVHDEPFRSINELMTRTRTDPAVMMNMGIDLLLHALLDKLIDFYEPILEHMQEQIDGLEERAVTDPTPDLLPKLASQKRDLLNLRKIIGPQREVLAQLTRGEVPFIRETARMYLRDVLDHLNRAVESIELYRDLVASARDIYLSSVSNNLNRIMKTLTVITVVTLPLNVVTGFFGMNLEIPGVHTPVVFWIAVLLMAISVTSVLVMFKRKNWL